MKRRRACCMIFSSIIILCSLIRASECFTKEKTPQGWTDPKGMIIIEKGTKLSIKCIVEADDEDDDRQISSRLGFHNQTSNQPIDNQFIHILNNTAIELIIPKVPEQDSMLVCKLDGNKGITYNDIKVGHKPDKISVIDCISRNWENLTCVFEKPNNPVMVQYELTYRVRESSQKHSCVQSEKRDSKIFECTVISTSYRKFSPQFVLMLHSNNSFGVVDQTFDFDNFAHIIPDKPDKLQETIVNSDSVTLNWTAPLKLFVFQKSYDFEFSINPPPVYGANETRILIRNVSAMDNVTKSYNYTIPLKYAFTWYDIAVRMKVSIAEDVERMWSDWAKIQVKTTARQPDYPPQIDVGAFNIINEDVYIYWRNLPLSDENGENFTYVIKSSNKQHESPTESSIINAVYRKELNNLSKDTKITIRSKNSEGISSDASELIIPGEKRRLAGPTKIKKKTINGTYYLSWSAPEENHESITSYTVFWCSSRTELINQCESSIDFVRRLPYETSFQYKSNQTINFAISANSESSTSGMIWAKCTTANSYEIGRIGKPRINHLSSTEIGFEWSLDCTDSGIVAGYQIEYCPSDKPKTLECRADSEEKINITDTSKFILSGLTPYTTYKIVIRMFSKTTMGPASEPLANTTLEAAPSEVRNLIARNVGNTTVDLYWDPPEYFNGVITSYDVFVNGAKLKVEFDRQHHNNVTKMNYTVENLQPYTDYDIAVQGCTIECSLSAKTKIKTTIGAPGDFSKYPTIEYKESKYIFNNNYTSGIIKWDEPIFKGGHLDYYELKTVFRGNDDTIQESIIKLKSRECYMEKLCINNVTGTYEFSVRAVNFVLTPHASNPTYMISGYTGVELQHCANDEILLDSMRNATFVDNYAYYLPGPWSEVFGHSCHYSNFNSKQYIFIMILMVASLVFVIMVFYLYRRIKDMKDILVQLPPGLEDINIHQGDKTKKGKDLSVDKKKPDLLHNVDNQFITNEDEHGRLLKRSFNSINGADCSSSIHSGSSRSEIEQAEMIDEIEYNEFGQQNAMSDTEVDTTAINKRPQSFIMNLGVPKEVGPILISPESISASTPMADKLNMTRPNTNIIMNIKTPKSGYVAPPTHHSTPLPINSNGYVTQSMLNPTQSSGYTQLNCLGKPILNNDRILIDKINLKTPIVATTDQEGISGYVTHKQLSDFGHRMQ